MFTSQPSPSKAAQSFKFYISEYHGLALVAFTPSLIPLAFDIMPNQITDSFHLHPILPVAFGFDHTMVFPLPSDPPRPTSNLTGPIPDMLDRVDNDANEDRDPVSPAITVSRNLQ